MTKKDVLEAIEIANQTYGGKTVFGSVNIGEMGQELLRAWAELKEVKGEVLCSACNGKGTVLNDNYALAHPEWEACEPCQGTGKKYPEATNGKT